MAIKKITLEEYCKSTSPTSFRAEVDGRESNSLYGKIKSVYYESGAEFFEKSKKNPAMWKTFYNPANPFFLLPEKTDLEITIEPNACLQLFINPTFEKKFTKEDSPKEYKKDFDDEISNYSYGKLSDFCLLKNKEYFVNLKNEDYECGPPDKETGLRRHSTATFVQISSLPFKSGKPQLPQTPANKNAVFG